MAIEDTVVLAKCMRDQADLEAAFVAYEDLGREQCQDARPARA